jgi:hypothetical protein
MYSVPFAPHTKPIETAFATVKRYIREHENEALLNPVDFINVAMAHFGQGGAHNDSIRGHWNRYFEVYALYRIKCLKK